MPGGLTAGDRRLFIGAGAVLAVLMLVSVLLTSGTGNAIDVPTTYSVGSSGAKAAWRARSKSKRPSSRRTRSFGPRAGPWWPRP